MELLELRSGPFFSDYGSRCVLHDKNKPPGKWSKKEVADFDRVFNTVLELLPPWAK